MFIVLRRECSEMSRVARHYAFQLLHNASLDRWVPRAGRVFKRSLAEPGREDATTSAERVLAVTCAVMGQKVSDALKRVH
jgi:hypothetical protein